MSEVQINGRDIVGLLRAEARKKPKIAALVESASGMSDAEIDALKVPLPWYRKALKKLRDLNIREHDTLTVTAAIADQTHLVYINDQSFGTTRRWDDGDTFIQIGKSGNAVELKTGQYVWFPERGGVWIDTIFSNSIDPKLIGCVSVERNKRSDYNRMVAERRRGFAGEGVPSIGPDSQQNSSWFRIERI